MSVLLIFILFWSCPVPTNSDGNPDKQTLPEFIQTGSGTVYYVSNSGNDDADGLSPATAWATLDKVNEYMFSFQPGDSILFKRGDTFRGHLEPMAGSETNWIKYSSYGMGNKPLIVGSMSLGNEADWELYSGNVWRTVPYNETAGTGVEILADVGGVFFNSVDSDGYYEEFGLWNRDISALTVDKDFYCAYSGFDESSVDDRSLYLYSSGGNPASVYTEIEISLKIKLVEMDERRYVLFEGLHLSRGAWHGFSGSNVHDLIIRGCDFSYIGGAFFDVDTDTDTYKRFGNGIEFWNNTSHVLVDANRFWEIYDTAVTNQGNSRFSHQQHIYYMNNVMWNCGLASFELWLRDFSSRMEHIYFLHNTSVNPGFGWGGSQNREDKNSFHVASFYDSSAGDTLVIKNNIFYTSADPPGSEHHLSFWDENVGGTGFKKYRIDNNLWSMPSPKWALTASAVYIVFSEWQSSNNQSENGIADDPLFSDFANDDFSLQAGSPAIDAGSASLRKLDFNGNPASGSPDIGAIEF